MLVNETKIKIGINIFIKLHFYGYSYLVINIQNFLLSLIYLNKFYRELFFFYRKKDYSNTFFEKLINV